MKNNGLIRGIIPLHSTTFVCSIKLFLIAIAIAFEILYNANVKHSSHCDLLPLGQVFFIVIHGKESGLWRKRITGQPGICMSPMSVVGAAEWRGNF